MSIKLSSTGRLTQITGTKDGRTVTLHAWTGKGIALKLKFIKILLA